MFVVWRAAAPAERGAWLVGRNRDSPVTPKTCPQGSACPAWAVPKTGPQNPRSARPVSRPVSSPMFVERVGHGVVERQRAPFRLGRDQCGVFPEGGRDPRAL